MTLDGRRLERERWFDAEPRRLRVELEAMATVAPKMIWDPSLSGGGWMGELPLWPFDRPEPSGIHDAFDHGLIGVISCSPAHPMIAPTVLPFDPDVPITYRTDHDWHVNGDGTLCLLQTATAWSGRELSAQLAIKAAGWFLEYHLEDTGVITKMTLGGIAATDGLDGNIADMVRRRTQTRRAC